MNVLSGTIYPANAKPGDFIKYYVRQFNTIELNATHYRTPDAETVKRWRKLAPAHFKFCPKIHQDISHSENLMQSLNTYNECSHLFSKLDEKLGTSFLQLPPHFSPQRLEELIKFLDHGYHNELAIELRHPDWFKESAPLNALCNYLYKHKMALVFSDTPGRRDVMHMRLTIKTALIRFNANNNHSTDKIRMNDWIDRINTWIENGLETVYFFVHTPNQEQMPHLVTYFISQIQQVCGIKLEKPMILEPSRSENMLF
jgi:uncharacterized protein YecE (DUF72 family)